MIRPRVRRQGRTSVRMILRECGGNLARAIKNLYQRVFKFSLGSSSITILQNLDSPKSGILP
ncbi:MAG: hypothetical protein ACFCBU_07190, partial [Cyanophyceae cyanobacterium]